MKRSIIPLTLTILMMIFIVRMSSMPGDESAKLSGFIVRVLERLIPVFHQLSGEAYDGALTVLSWLVRKGAHFTEYAVLGGLAMLTWCSLLRWAWFSLPVAIIFCGVFAATDEFHQSFVPGRVMASGDVVIDTCGVLLGGILVFLVARPRRIVVSQDD